MDKRQTTNDKRHLISRLALIVIFLPMIFFSCEKEIVDPQPDSDETPITYNIFPAEMRNYSHNNSFARFPPKDLYEDVLLKLYTDSLFLANYDSMALDFGHPRINFATFDVKSPTEYILTLPLVKEDRITAFIFYYANSNHAYFTFAPLSIGMELLSQSVNQSFDQDPIMTLIKYNNYLYTRYSSYSESINNWLIDYHNFHNQIDEASERNSTIKVTYTTVSFPEPYVEEITQHSFNVTFVCPIESELSSGFLRPGTPGAGEGLPGGAGSNIPNDTPFGTLDPGDIDEDCRDYQFTEEALMQLENLAGGDYYSCNGGELSTEEIIENILAALCIASGAPNQNLGTGDISNVINESIIEEYINNALAEEEYVIYNQLKNSCPKLQCILDHLMSSDPGEALCPDFIFGLLQPFVTNGKLHLRINAAPLEGNYQGGLAFNTLDFGTGTDPSTSIDIIFEENYCDTASSFNLYSTLLHEMIHADIKRRLIQDFGLSDVNDIDSLFGKLLEEMGYDGNNWNDEHQLMLIEYLTQMAESLWLANGSEGELGWYYGYILNGFPPELVLLAHDDFVDEAHLQAAIEASTALINEIHHENFTLCD